MIINLRSPIFLLEVYERRMNEHIAVEKEVITHLIFLHQFFLQTFAPSALPWLGLYLLFDALRWQRLNPKVHLTMRCLCHPARETTVDVKRMMWRYDAVAFENSATVPCQKETGSS
jgi:hypothetical protein